MKIDENDAENEILDEFNPDTLPDAENVHNEENDQTSDLISLTDKQDIKGLSLPRDD